MWLLVGLGNPGSKYEKNRHNIGFWALDAMADAYARGGFKSKFNGEYAEASIDGKKVVLLKPLTYMNESGQSVGKAAKFYKIPPENIIVFHDELDLEPGKVRVKMGGGLAGHNGLKSIKAHLGTPEFLRVRIGIGHPGDKNRVSGYVLSDFSKAEMPLLEKITAAMAEHSDHLLSGAHDVYMSKIAEDTAD